MIRKMSVMLIAVATAALVGACGPQPTTTPPADPAPPAIDSFTTPGGPFTAPALVPLAWTVSDVNHDDLTCRLDHEDDGTYDETIQHCGSQSREIEAATGSHVARLEVTDGNSAPVTRIVVFDVTDAVVPPEPFDITLRPLHTMTAPVLAAFTAAAARWQSVITAGVPDQQVTLTAGDCLDDEPGLPPTTVDDLLITVDVVPIDGAGGILGQAGPCIVSSTDSLARAGVMQFDSADDTSMLADGTFTSVVLHEMGHILGIGTLWDYNRTYLAGAGGANPTFSGPRGVAEWSALGGTGPVPVENTGGSGTADAHWRESTFFNELMTGWISAGSNPLSAMTIASLGDLGYHVDRSKADAYTWPLAGAKSPTPAATRDLGRMLRPPISEQ
jgi:hypothetical protein